MKVLKEFLPYIIIILVVFLLRQFVISPIQVVGTSMLPNLDDGELMLLDKISYRFKDVERYDVVVINKDSDDPIIKRIIGLPGEEVRVTNNKLFINDKEIYQNFETNGNTSDFDLSSLDQEKIPEDYYFVLGDNRVNSIDSRIIGLIHKDEIEGKAFFVLFPFEKFGSI